MNEVQDKVKELEDKALVESTISDLDKHGEQSDTAAILNKSQIKNLQESR